MQYGKDAWKKCVELRVSEDGLRAVVDLSPPASKHESYNIHHLLSELETAGVSWGVEREALEKVLLRCLEEQKKIWNFVAARGLKVRKSVPSYWHLKERLILKPKRDTQAPSVDYKDTSPFILVKKGEALARRIPESPGKPGRTVRGEILPVIPKEVVNYRPGENTLEKDDVLYAACSGRFEITDRALSVSEVLEIAGNVDYSTGHIVFPGNLLIRGAVCDGFHVAAGKAIIVKQTMDASQVFTRDDLVVEGGIKGRGDGLIHVEGRMKAKFIENASVEAHGSVEVEKAVVHSEILTDGMLELGEKGNLVGGDVSAQEGIRVGNIGRSESPSAHLWVGSSYGVDRKLRYVRNSIDRLESKLTRLRSRQSLSTKQQELVARTEKAIAAMRREKQVLLGQLHPQTQARITVFGKVLEGTELRICDAAMHLDAPMEAITFYYEPDGPRVAYRGIVESDRPEKKK